MAEGALVFAKACELGLEGILSKLAGRLYRVREEPQLAEDEEPEFCQDVASCLATAT